MTIVDYLRRNAAQYGEETALVAVNPGVKEKRRVTWRDYNLIEASDPKPFRREITWNVFDEKASRFANLLISRGIKKGDRVAILLMNCIEWLPAYFGALKTGAIAVPLNFRYTADEIAYCLDLAEANALVFGSQFVGRMEDALPKMRHEIPMFYIGNDCPSFAEDYAELTSNCSGRDPMIPLTLEDDAAIYYSSGTTGFPKAILHNHQSLMHAALTEQNHHGQTRDDVFLCIPPLYHTGAKMHWFGSLVSGSRAVILQGADPRTILETASSERCTIVWLLVPWAQDILLAIERGEVDLEDYELEQWRLMHIGAQPVPKSLIAKWKSIFPHHDYDTNYGLSESIGPGCVHLGLENIEHVGAIGVAGYGWELKIVDPAGDPVVPGEVGELCVKGPGLMTCYYNNPEATAEVLVDGWLLTGDMARQDEFGMCWLVDRKKDVVISGGENIYPVQIEDFLSKHPAIKDVAVIGLPHERLGEIPAAIVELKPDFAGKVDEADIDEFCQALPRYKRPKRIILADVPRNPTGKIEKPKLREMYGAERLVDQQVGD